MLSLRQVRRTGTTVFYEVEERRADEKKLSIATGGWEPRSFPSSGVSFIELENKEVSYIKLTLSHLRKLAQPYLKDSYIRATPSLPLYKAL